jgi:hypothetical protein
MKINCPVQACTELFHHDYFSEVCEKQPPKSSREGRRVEQTDAKSKKYKNKHVSCNKQTRTLSGRCTITTQSALSRQATFMQRQGDQQGEIRGVWNSCLQFSMMNARREVRFLCFGLTSPQTVCLSPVEVTISPHPSVSSARISLV